MTSPRHIPIFDGHNDVLLRLYRRGGTDAARAFLEGKGKGQLDLPMARQGGFAGGLFAIFVPSANAAVGLNGEARSQNVSSGAPLPPAVELMPAQRAVFAMVSLLLSNEFSRNVVAQPQAQTLLTCFGAPLATPIRSSLTCSSLNPAIVRPLKPKAITGF
jgi:microsomal dipeptidase-like Zn-dependent dipeptidase